MKSQSRKDEQGILLPREPDALDVRVTAGSLERAINVVSRIVTVLESQGFTVEIREETGIAAVVYGRHVRFSIDETVKRVVTKKPRVPNPTDRWDYDEVVSYEPTGMLALVIHSESWRPRALRKRWADAKEQRIENLIPSFIAGIMKTAVILQQEDDEKKQRVAEQKRRADELTELRKQVETEEKKIEQLNSWADSWEKAEKLRRFIATYAERAKTWAGEKHPQYEAWVKWASIQADRLDPFISPKPASVLDRKHELRAW